MSQSISLSSARQGRLPAVTSIRSVVESSPLLSTPSNDGLKIYATVNQGTRTTHSERFSTSLVLWIMCSVWIGTFLAGLGEQRRRDIVVAFAVSSRDKP